MKKNITDIVKLIHWRSISPKVFSVILFMLIIVSIPVLAYFRYTSILNRTPIYQKVQKWEQQPLPPLLTREQTLQLGRGHTPEFHPQNSYILYPKQKTPNSVRIGIFGDSYTEGAEVAPGYEFPTLLQKKFDRAGFKNVEVINFGLSGRGVSHMYLLWNYLGKDYGLDYVVLFPFDFHQLRDESFCNVCTHESIFARFIMQGDGFMLIPVIGETSREAIETYHSFFTPWQYIRYDNRMPMLLKVFLPGRLHRWTNPLYYKIRKFNRGEILDIYQMLFDDLAKQVNNLVIVANDDQIYSVKEKMETDHVSFLKSQVRFVNSLYHAPKFHNSAIGNDLRAAELFSWFIGKRSPDFTIVEVLPESAAGNARENSQPLPLYAFQEVYISIGSFPIADFVRGLGGHYYGTLGDKFDFRKHKTVSLFSIDSLFDSSEPLTIRFLPLDFSLNKLAPIVLAFTLNGTAVKVPIGVVEGGSGVIGTLRLEEPDEMIKRGEHWSLRIKKGLMIVEGKGSLDNFTMMIGDREVLTLKGSLDINSMGDTTTIRIEPKDFSPLRKEWIYLRGNAGHYMDVENVSFKNGNLDLVLKLEDGRTFQYPVLPFTISKMKTQEFNPPNHASLIP